MQTKQTFLALALGLGALAAPRLQAQTVTLTLDSVVPWVAFNGHAGSNNFSGAIAGMLNFTVTSQSGMGLNAYPTTLALFCVELQQHIILRSTGNLYSIIDAEGASNGVHTGHSANIPLSGIGSTRTQNLEVLYAHVFGTNYNPAGLTDTRKSAFQLAVWELSHDDNFNLNNGSGNQFWVTTAGSAVTEAQTLVNWVQANTATAARMELSALHNTSTQDFLIPTSRNFSAIPEPSTSAFAAGVASLGAAVYLRRKRTTLA